MPDTSGSAVFLVRLREGIAEQIKKVTSERILSMPTPTSQLWRLRSCGWWAGWQKACLKLDVGPSKHSSFLPTLTARRGNRANLVNVSAMVMSTDILTHLVFCSPFSSSEVLKLILYPNSATFFPFSAIPVHPLALDNQSTSKGQPPHAPVRPRPTLHSSDNLDPVILSLPSLALPPIVMKSPHSLGRGPLGSEARAAEVKGQQLWPLTSRSKLPLRQLLSPSSAPSSPS